MNFKLALATAVAAIALSPLHSQAAQSGSHLVAIKVLPKMQSFFLTATGNDGRKIYACRKVRDFRRDGNGFIKTDYRVKNGTYLNISSYTTSNCNAEDDNHDAIYLVGDKTLFVPRNDGLVYLWLK